MKVKLWLLILFVAVMAIQVSAQQEGCLTEPIFVTSQSGCEVVPWQIANDSCQGDSQCLQKYFFEGFSCDEITNTINGEQVKVCDDLSGWCDDEEEQGCSLVSRPAQCFEQKSFSAGDKPLSCKEGCCICEKNSQTVSAGLFTSKQCDFTCESEGYSVGKFKPGLTTEQCGDLADQPIEFSNISGFVKEGDQPIKDVTIVVSGRTTSTDSSGFYRIVQAPVGQTTITANKPGFTTNSIIVTTEANKEKEANISLTSTNTWTLKGNILNENDNPVSGALVKIFKPNYQQEITTSDDGSFKIENIPLGSFTIEATAFGYGISSTPVSINTPVTETKTIKLSIVDEATITGTVVDQEGNPIIGVQVNVGSELTTATKDKGVIKPIVVSSGNYWLSFVKPGYKYFSEPRNVMVAAGEVKQVDIVMEHIVGECDYVGEPDNNAKPPTFLEVEHVLGKKQLMLRWGRPCPQVASYIITKEHAGIEEKIIITDQSATTYTDDIEWNTEYTYRIKAIYTDGPSGRESNKVTKSIKTGDEECEDAFKENQPIEFCGQKNDELVLRQRCSTENKVELVPTDDYDCSQSSPPSLCVGPDPINFKTRCASPAVCGVTDQNAEPYGIGFTEQTCYGEKSSNTGFYANACYYDYTDTIFNQCFSCDQLVENGKVSCFKIRSENACVKSYNCGAGGTNGCKWINTSLQNSIGSGYCVEKNYEKIDKCSLCDRSAGPFNNIQCSDDICTSLGSCYSNPKNTSCETCNPDTTCYDYSSKTSCSSNDVCGLNSCGWVNDECVKDNDDDLGDDCIEFTDPFVNQLCRKDNEAPVTAIQSEGDILILSNAHPTINFSVIDNLKSAKFKTIEICLILEGGPTCKKFDYQGKNKFIFDARTTNINVIDLKTLLPGDYVIEYRSKDRYNNLEEFKSQAVFIDFTDLGLEIIETKVTEDDAAGSSLDVTVSATKEVTCKHKLIDRNDQITKLISEDLRQTLQGARFTSLTDGLYAYEVECEDDYGNKETAMESGIKIDALQTIERILPLEVTEENTFRFTVKTKDAAKCTLLNSDSLSEEMSSDDGLIHKSEQKKFSIGYNEEYSVSCISQNEPDEISIPFTIDRFLSPPTTTAVIIDATRRRIKEQKASWEKEFFGNASVQLKAVDNPPPKNKNFGVKETRYCITEPGKKCNPERRFGQEILIKQTSSLCYLSEDNGGHLELRKCGTIIIKPALNIIAVQPKEFVHAGERYLVVEDEPFDFFLASFLRVSPIKQCKWSSFEFDYENNVQAERIFEDSSINEISTDIPTGTDKFYKKLNWPTTSTGVNIPTGYDDPYKMFIQCKDFNNELTDFENILILKDDTPPKILEARADPTRVIDLPQVTLIVKTDDLTRCSYQREGKDPQGFPGFQSREFDFEHEKTIILGGEQGEFTYSIICENGIGNVTIPTNITFEVDYSVLGSITGKSPSGFIKAQSVTLEINTSKQTSCKLATQKTNFKNTGNTHRIKNILTTEEKEYNFPVSCVEIGPTQITFTVDRTPPVINSLDDNNETCTTKTASITVKAEDSTSKVSKYSYKLKEQGTNEIIKEERSGKSQYLLKNLNLIEGNNYYWTVKPIDEAGNEGTEKDSDGFIVESPNSTICKSKLSRAPIVTLSKTITSTGVDVSLTCKDDNGCELTYGTTLISQTCKPETDYSDSISLDQSSYICYTATDGAGKKTSKTVFIDVETELKKCQTTTDTLPEGCDVLLERDSDGDGLPDMWENRYATCSIENDKRDTDNDGITDDQEDCDDDGLTNYEEFLANTDPTVFDITDDDNDEIPDSKDKCLGTPAGESVITDEASKFYGCGPSQRDTDGDGMNDAYETKYGLDPQNSADSATDNDKDGLTNLEEFRLDTNPTKADTDGDGFKDGVEVEKGTDPLNSLSKPRSAFVIILYILLLLILTGGIGFLSWYLIVKKQILQKLQKNPPIYKQAPLTPPQTRRPISHVLKERRKKELEEQKAKREKIFKAFKKPETKEKSFKDLLKKQKSFEKLDRYAKPSNAFEKLNKYTKKPITQKKTTKKSKKPNKQAFEKLKKYSTKKTKKKTKKKSAFEKLKKYEKK